MNTSFRKLTFPPAISRTIQDLFIPERDFPYIYWMLAAITLIGTILRLWKINEPIAYDEAYTFIYYATKPFKQILSDYSAPNNHILHTILVSVCYKIFGGHTWIVRLPAFLAGMLSIPAGYFAARRFFDSNQSLAAASLVALTPWFVSYSTNGRGYTLLTFFALLLMNFAGILVRQQSRSTLLAYGITAALGFFTIPVFLYPMAGVSLWVLATYLADHEPWSERSKKIRTFLLACALAGILTILLYVPVIVFGTGAGSIFSNEIVEPRDWATFLENIRPRALKTWDDWMLNIHPSIQYALLLGFLLSILFYKKASNQKLPMQVFIILSIVILLVLQRVAPMPRVWIYLEMFYMVFAGAGLVWLVELLTKKMGNVVFVEKMISAAIVLIVMFAFANRYFTTRQSSVLANQNLLPEQYAAGYLAKYLRDGDKIVSVAPVDIRTAYYLFINGIPYDVFYQRNRPQSMQTALIVLRKNTQYNTPQSVLDFYQLTPNFDLANSQLVFEYGPLNIFSVPSH